MTNQEKKILKAVVDRGGLLSPADLINGIAKHDRRAVENLVVKKYLKEVPQDVPGITLGSTYSLNFYRPTEKALLIFSPWIIKMWHAMRSDIKTIIISAITAFITSLVTIFVGKFFD